MPYILFCRMQKVNSISPKAKGQLGSLSILLKLKAKTSIYIMFNTKANPQNLVFKYN